MWRRHLPCLDALPSALAAGSYQALVGWPQPPRAHWLDGLAARSLARLSQAFRPRHQQNGTAQPSPASHHGLIWLLSHLLYRFLLSGFFWGGGGGVLPFACSDHQIQPLPLSFAAP